MTGKSCPIIENHDLFKLDQCIGSGSFSIVYKAKLKNESSRTIAIKFYKEIKDVISRYHTAATEIAFVKFLNHPNIVKHTVSDIVKPHIFLGMEFCQYGSLSCLIKTGPLSEPLVHSIMKQLVCAVCYLQSMSILHGDIKPENILVKQRTPTIIIQLSDFGLAEVLITRENCSKLGSLFYMAPELVLHAPFDLSADLFSMGVVMFEMLYNETIFPRDISQTDLINFYKKKPKSVFPQGKVPTFSVDCADLLKKLLNFNKLNRPIGDNLKNHQFLKIIDHGGSYSNHYEEGCNCLIRCFDLVKSKQFGQAYIELTEAILHFKIYVSSVKEDAQLYTYMQKKLNTYNDYCKHFELYFKCNIYDGPERIALQEEELRYLISSTPTLHSAYEMCQVGEMFIHENNVAVGTKKLKEGLKILFDSIPKEPNHIRKTLLQKQVKKWVELLESLQQEHNNENG